MHFGKRLRQERLRLHLSQEALAEALAISARSIRRWEQGQALPQASVRLQLSRFFGLRPEELFEDQETQTPHTPLWCVPYPRNPFFTGREEILTTLHTALSINQEAAFTYVYALHGLGGVGKTQIALEFAFRFAQKYHAVFWIGTETAESLALSLLRIAETLQLPERGDRDQQRVITAVRDWLMTHHQWLLICDNVEDLGVLDRFLPSRRQGAVLLTTRLQALGTHARGIPLLPMKHREGMLFLLRRARVLEAEATGEPMHQLSVQQPSHYAAAAELVTATGGLPLALDQAGAYLEETQCGLPAYLDLFRTRRAALLQQRGEGAQNHPLPVSTTFALAVAATAERHPAVRDFLRVCALLQPDAIPEELFRQGGEHLGATLEAVFRDMLDWNRVVALACSYSLLSRQPEAQTFSIHRLMQAVLLDAMTETERKEWASRVVEALDAVFPEVQPTTEFAPWKKQCDRLVPHVLLCLHRIGDAEGSLALASLAYKVGQYLREGGQYAEAEPFYQRAVHIREQLLGSDHPEVARALNNLALIYWKKGQYTEAEPLFQRALYIWRQALGPSHPFIAVALNNLAILNAEQGKYAEAEPLFQRALHLSEQSQGPEHPDVARALHNLAELYTGQGKYAEAELLLQRGLSISRQALGPDDPLVAHALYNLAELSQEQGRYAEAESLYQQALRINEQNQGAESPDVALALNGLANLSREQGRYAEAKALYQQVLSIREQQLGQQHPETAQTLYDMAIFSQKQGDLGKALSFAERALKIRSLSLGDAHPKTVATRELYAQLVQEQGGAEQDPPSPETS
ncbi:tetratricopeptide repeat protein [Ktedonobacter sp. SOSP1-85]|uniref:FxSxx-COOH system tetratricopeptide repeat protein n=1 Tax=Ktedonobacter sp. SOSP1-85 TaxID=2778367 RepID=UPI001916A26B|nr:FxSxx-COOH system tetratricopeptide repeat protein [Ktedonobacter sp. SOSP1-85]GHO79852.1 tetratricopeptide repeat protein [Ktedonobacter sp. SOSP1-85]